MAPGTVAEAAGPDAVYMLLCIFTGEFIVRCMCSLTRLRVKL